MERIAPPFISRVRLRNFKSIAECDVRLGPLTVLVGPNGSGKSNFLDALAFLGRALATTPYEAINNRSGLGEILRRVPELTESFSIDIEATIPWGPDPDSVASVAYGFEIGPAERPGERPEVVHEHCSANLLDRTEGFDVDRGVVQDMSHPDAEIAIEQDRLYLPTASAKKNLAPLFARLREMRFYDFGLDELRQPRPQSGGSVLGQRGEHLGDVLGALSAERPAYKERLDAYLRAIVPDAVGIDRHLAGMYVTVVLRALTGPDHQEVLFGSNAMSDGTIRAAGVLAALFQLWGLDGRIPLIGIEEPEIALHPVATGVLFDALTEASEHVQVVATTQSPDLLDRDELDLSAIRAVSMENGLTGRFQSVVAPRAASSISM